MYGRRRRRQGRVHLRIASQGQPGQAGRACRIAQDMMVGLVVVLMVFGFAAWNNRAHAHGHDSAAHTMGLLALAGSVPQARESTGAVRIQRLFDGSSDVPTFAAPDVLPGAMSPPAGGAATRAAIGDQILWHYSGRAGDQIPWFAVEQSRKRAALTGRPQFLLMALVFAIMSAVTMGLWRQMNGAALRGHRVSQGPRRLR